MTSNAPMKEHEAESGTDSSEEASVRISDRGSDTGDVPEEKVVEKSPKGRFHRFNRKLGSGAYKTVYLAFDNDTGREVAWNVISFARLKRNERKRIDEEIQIAKSLDHPRILRFINAWINKEKAEVIFITERVTGGSLRQYINRLDGPLKLKVIRNWCKQILEGIVYLHSQSHPVIHRDLKCDNIFVNGNDGKVLIGDLGLSTALRAASCATSIVGTPEFMAPELYEEKYGPAVDIYAFGMCLLEMVTRKFPYSECATAGQIYKKVISGEPPKALFRIKDQSLRDMIDKCIAVTPETRPSAEQLLNDSFWNEADGDNLAECEPEETIAQEGSVSVKGSHAWKGRSKDFDAAANRSPNKSMAIATNSQQPVVTSQPTAQQPLVQHPLVQQPLVQQPLVQQPLVQQAQVQQQIVTSGPLMSGGSVLGSMTSFGESPSGTSNIPHHLFKVENDEPLNVARPVTSNQSNPIISNPPPFNSQTNPPNNPPAPSRPEDHYDIDFRSVSHHASRAALSDLDLNDDIPETPSQIFPPVPREYVPGSSYRAPTREALAQLPNFSQIEAACRYMQITKLEQVHMVVEVNPGTRHGIRFDFSLASDTIEAIARELREAGLVWEGVKNRELFDMVHNALQIRLQEIAQERRAKYTPGQSGSFSQSQMPYASQPSQPSQSQSTQSVLQLPAQQLPTQQQTLTLTPPPQQQHQPFMSSATIPSIEIKHPSNFDDSISTERNSMVDLLSGDSAPVQKTQDVSPTSGNLTGLSNSPYLYQGLSSQLCAHLRTGAQVEVSREFRHIGDSRPETAVNQSNDSLETVGFTPPSAATPSAGHLQPAELPPVFVVPVLTPPAHRPGQSATNDDLLLLQEMLSIAIPEKRTEFFAAFNSFSGFLGGPPGGAPFDQLINQPQHSSSQQSWPSSPESADKERLTFALKSAGFVPGEFCEATEASVRDFQERFGLAATGFVTDRTWTALCGQVEVKRKKEEEKMAKREEARNKAKQENDRKLQLQQQESAKALDSIIEKTLNSIGLGGTSISITKGNTPPVQALVGTPTQQNTMQTIGQTIHGSTNLVDFNTLVTSTGSVASVSTIPDRAFTSLPPTEEPTSSTAPIMSTSSMMTNMAKPGGTTSSNNLADPFKNL